MSATNSYLVVCRDAAGAGEKRTRLLDEHLRYVVSVESRYRVAGVLLAADQKSVVGSAVVVEAQDPADARRVITDDPYFPAGVWAQIEVMPYLVAFGTMTPKRLDYSTRIPGYENAPGQPGARANAD